MDKEEHAGKSILSSQKPEHFRFSEDLDCDHLVMIYEDDLERASAIFEIFLNGIDKEMQGLFEMEAENNTSEFLRKIHKLAPNFAMVGLSEATEELFEIERKGKACGMTPLLRDMFASFNEKLETRLDLVKNEQKRIQNYMNK